MEERMSTKRNKPGGCRGSDDVGKQNGGSGEGMRPSAVGNPFEELEQTTDFTTWLREVRM